MHCSSFPALPVRWSQLRLFLALLFLGGIVASPSAALGASEPRPYVQGIGTQSGVIGTAVAPNGYSFILLSNGSIAVFDPAQVVRTPIVIPGLSQPRAIATSSLASLVDATTVRLYIATTTQIWIANFDTAKGVVTDQSFTKYTFPSGRIPVAMAVQPAAGGSVFVCGSDTAATPGTTKNFVMKISAALDAPSFKVWGQKKTFGSYTSPARNQVNSIAADISGNVYVSGQWDSVIYTAEVTYDQYSSRSTTWKISDADLGPLTNTIQSSIRTYTTLIALGPLKYYHDIGVDSANRTGYIVKFSSSLNPTAYTNTTSKVGALYPPINILNPVNSSSFCDLRIAPNNFLYAAAVWRGTSDYGTTSNLTTLNSSWIEIVKFDPSNLSAQGRAVASAQGSGNQPHSLDLDGSSNVYVSGVLDEPTTTFSGVSAQPVAGRSVFLAQLKPDLADWSFVNRSNAPAPGMLGNTTVRWNTKSSQAELAGTFYNGQLSLGLPTNPGLLPLTPAPGYINFYALADDKGKLIGQYGVTVHSDFVQGNQVSVTLGDSPPAPLTSFDPLIHEGGVSLLSTSAGTIVTVRVPPRIYIDKVGNQVFPDYDPNNNEIAPAAAVTRHICTGFSVTGEATTGATNTYTFILAGETKVIFNWRTEHALEIASAVKKDLGLPESTGLALGNPDPVVNKTWIPENQPVTSFIDGATADLAVYGKRYRVIGFDATASALERPDPLPPLPASRALLTAKATVTEGSPSVTLADGAPLEVGWVVTGDGIPVPPVGAPPVTIVAKSGLTQFTLSTNAIASSSNATLTFDDSLVKRSVGAALTKGNASVTLAAPTGVKPGWLVSGPSIPLGTAVSAVADSTHVTLTKAPVPITRSSTTSIPPVIPSFGVDSVTTAGSATVTLPGGSAVVAGMIVTGAGIVPVNTTVTAIADVKSQVSSTLTSGSAEVKIPYSPLSPPLSPGNPVTGSTHIPVGTTINTIAEVITKVKTTTVNGTASASVPATPTLLVGNIVRGSGIAATPDTTITSITPVTRSVKTITSNNSTAATVGFVAGGELIIGSLVSGSGITPGTEITGNVSDPLLLPAVTAVGSPTVTGVATSGLAVGDPVSGAVPAGTTIQAIDSPTQLTLSANATAVASTLTFTRKKLTFSNAANPGGANNLTYTIGRTLGLSRAVTTTVSVPADFDYVTELKLTLSNPVNTTIIEPLDYTTARALTLSQAALATGTNILSYSPVVANTATTVAVVSTSGLSVGMAVTGPSIPANTTIVAIVNDTTLTLSQAATVEGTNNLEYFAPVGTLTFNANFGSYAFDEVRARQQVPQWLMSGPATITYRWATQYHVMVSTTVQAAQSLPEVRSDDPAKNLAQGMPGYGSGEHWFDAGAHVFVGSKFGGGAGSRQLLGWVNATMPPFFSDQGTIDANNDPVSGTRGTPAAFYYTEISNLQFPITVLWNYGGTIHREKVTIGQPVTFTTNPALSAAQVATAQAQAPDRRTVVEGPSGSSGDQMALWDPKAKKLYPVRPGVVLLEYGSQSDPTIVEITSGFPGDPGFSGTPSFLHLTHPDLPSITLDPSGTDAIAFQQLAYSSGDATAINGAFLNTKNGKTTLVFTVRDPGDTAPANGDQVKEKLVVKVVETKQWDEVLGNGSTPAVIGSKLKHPLPSPATDVLETGFVVHENARYNAALYNRSKIIGSGPIIPVNRQFTGDPEDELVVIWFSPPDLQTGIVWANSVERFDANWPTNPPRIVIASRLGSEGKDNAGLDQISYSSDRYQSVAIYNQPDRAKPGYNPNEEHAILAPSFKFSDQANPPPAAYALQTGGLNVLHDAALAKDELYTSDPYVLVQYYDRQAKESKMEVYTVQSEDPRAALNPDIDARTGRRFSYTFDYTMVAGEPVQPPYPLARVIGLVASPETFGMNTSPVRAYWEDYNGVAYAAGQGAFSSYFHYRLTDEFWFGEGDAAKSTGTSIPFGTSSFTPLLRTRGTVVNTGTAKVFTGVTAAPTFTIGDRFSVDTGRASGPVTVTLVGPTSGDFVNSILTAFPDGELVARKTADAHLELVLYGGASLTISEDPATGTALVKAGFLTALDPAAEQSVTLASAVTINAGFIPGNTFIIDTGLPPASVPTTITLTGPTAQDFVDAVNTAFPTGKVVANLSAAGRIELTASGVPALKLTDGIGTPLSAAGLRAGTTLFPAQEVRYFAKWPTNPPILKAGETLTYSGGEYRADHPGAPGLPGVLGWATGELIFDSLNPQMRTTGAAPNAFSTYTARLISPLEPRRVALGTVEEAGSVSSPIQPATGITSVSGTVWKFNNLPASLSRRLFYDPLSRELGMIGFVNEKTLGNSSLTAAPPPVYALEPNILTEAEKRAMLDIPELASNQVWVRAVNALFALGRNPNALTNGADAGQAPYYVGLTQGYSRHAATGEVLLDADAKPILEPNSAMPQKLFGPGLALVPSPAFLDPANPLSEGYVTLVENNDKTIGGPVTLRVIKVSRNDRYRGAIKTIATDNVFSEQLTLRHTGDFGANADDIVYQWFYREEDGNEAPLPPSAVWQLFADSSNNEPRGLGMYQIELKGNPILLLADQLIFLRYRHKNEVPAGGANSTDWAGTKWAEYGSEFAGAANSGPGNYQPQLAQGWVKRVLDRINPYEARFNDFRNNGAPATYASMILQAGQHYEGPVALNPDKDVIENVGLIELYQTILDRGRGLSIDLSSPVSTPGINNALLLAATRVSDLYLLLGNEAYSDAQDPTVGFGSTSADYGSAAPSIFSFQNQVPTLLDEELALLRGNAQTYGRPAYNRLFWNFTKSEGEVAYAMNYNITDQNRDGFIDEKDAMLFYPQGHGDAWGHYLTAIKSQYSLLQHPYFNWVSRSEFYNLLDVVLKVDFLDERKFADSAAARAKAGAEIVNLTYRSRYVENPDGQWQGYADTDGDRAWGVDEWARRAGQGAYFDWITANALIPPTDTAHTGIQQVDRTTVTAIHNISTQLGKIQATEDDANTGLNPLGLAADVVPMDFDPTLITPGTFSQSHFEQIAARADTALANAVKVFDNASQQSNRIRMQATTAATFMRQTYEQDRDYRNRLIEIFGTPYSGQIGAGKIYPTGYTGPDLALYMYVDVNDVSSDTVPGPNGFFTDVWNAFPQMLTIDPKSISLGAGSVTTSAQFANVFSQYFLADVISPVSTTLDNKLVSPFFDPTQMAAGYSAITSVDSYFHALSLDLNMPVTASAYTFQAPADWGRRSAPGELQSVISELVQAQASLGYSVGDYDYLILQIQAAAEQLRAQHALQSETVQVNDNLRKVTLGLNSVIAGLKVVSAAFDTQTSQRTADAIAEFFPRVNGIDNDFTSAGRGGAKLTGSALEDLFTGLKIGTDAVIDAIEIGKDDLATQSSLEIEKAGFALEIQGQLKELELMLWNEAALRVEVFRRLELMRQISDRYRTVLQKGLALIDERADFNRNAAGATQQVRYQDMGFRVFRNDALQKYRASFDLAARYVYLAAKAYDFETNLDPGDPASAQPLLQDIVRSRTLGVYQNGATNSGGGLSAALATLRANYSVLKGRLGLNNPQMETSGFSMKREQARTNAAGWKQLLQNSRKDDLWTVPEFRRYCRPPIARSAGKLPGLVIPFSTQTVFGRNFFGKALAAGDVAFNPTNFANKIASAGLYFEGYPVASLAATPQAYLVPAGLDVLTVPNSLALQTRTWTVLDQALPVPFPVGNHNLSNPDWIPITDGLSGPLAEIRRFSSFRAGVTAGAPPLATDTRLTGRSVWNTNWLLIIPGGTMLSDGDKALDSFINNVTDIKLYFSTYGYSGN